MEQYMKDYDVTLRLGSVEKTYPVTANDDRVAVIIAKFKATLDETLPGYEKAELVSCKLMEGY